MLIDVNFFVKEEEFVDIGILLDMLILMELKEVWGLMLLDFLLECYGFEYLVWDGIVIIISK